VGTVSIQEAAALLGVSAPTIRRWIKSGKVQAIQEPTPQGFEWRVVVPDHIDQVHDRSHTQERDQGTDQSLDRVQPESALQAPIHANDHMIDQLPSDQAMSKAIDLIERLQRENLQLGGRVGWLEAQLQAAQERIRLLEAGHPMGEEEPKEPPAEEPAEDQPSWWQRLRRRWQGRTE
jgi:hypothetical protein